MIRILIPVFNEEKNIRLTVEGIRRSLGSRKYKIYLINDGSSDGSLKVMKKLRTVIVNHNINLGVAAALKTGLVRILKEGGKNDVVIVMEGDNTSTPDLLPDMIREISHGADIVTASRYSKGGKYVNFPIRRLVLSIAANKIMATLYPYKNVSDYTIFYRAYRQKLLARVFERHGQELFKTRYFTANCELLVRCLSFKPNVREVGYYYDYGKKKGRSGLKIAKNVWQYLRLFGIIERL